MLGQAAGRKASSLVEAVNERWPVTSDSLGRYIRRGGTAARCLEEVFQPTALVLS